MFLHTLNNAIRFGLSIGLQTQKRGGGREEVTPEMHTNVFPFWALALNTKYIYLEEIIINKMRK